jgi:hypothetical protein
VAELFGLSGGNIAFESRGKTHRFGIGLEESEAQTVVTDIQAQLAEFSTSGQPS